MIGNILLYVAFGLLALMGGVALVLNVWVIYLAIFYPPKVGKHEMMVRIYGKRDR